jgi:hypothetical protein
MNYKELTLLMAVPVLSGNAIFLHADDTLWPESERLSLSYRMSFNVSAKFRNVGSVPFPNNPSVTGLSYQDGFVGTDNTGNAGGLTSYWGYQNANQVVDNNNYLVMRSANSGALGSSVDDGPYHGLELSFNHEFARYQRVRWGIEAALNWADFSADQVTAPSAGVLAVDAFSLGYNPPQPPFTGTPNAGPFTPLLGTTPTRLPATVSSALEASLYGFRLGPYLDVPLGKRVLLTFSAGMALTIVDGEYASTESYTTPGGTTATIADRASEASPVLGGFVNVQASLKLREHMNVFTGLQYQGSDSYKLSAGDKEAQIDFTGVICWSCGLSFSF